jgi:hypothetical protein
VSSEQPGRTRPEPGQPVVEPGPSRWASPPHPGTLGPLTWAPRRPGTLGRHRRRAAARNWERAAPATCWGLEAGRLAPTACLPRRPAPLKPRTRGRSLSKPARTKGSEKAVTPERARSSCDRRGAARVPGKRAVVARVAQGVGAFVKSLSVVFDKKGQNS